MTEQYPHIDPEVASHSFGSKTPEELDALTSSFPADFSALLRAAIPEIQRRRRENPKAGDAFRDGVVATLSAIAASEAIAGFVEELNTLTETTEPPQAA